MHAEIFGMIRKFICSILRSGCHYHLLYLFSFATVSIVLSVTRNSDGSDAQACHNMWPICKPRCVGVEFLILSVLFQVVGLYLALVWLIST